LAGGFRTFRQDRNIAAAVASSLASGLKQEQSNPYDTHPALGERIAALAELPPGATATDEPLAITLLDDVAAQAIAQSMVSPPFRGTTVDSPMGSSLGRVQD